MGVRGLGTQRSRLLQMPGFLGGQVKAVYPQTGTTDGIRARMLCFYTHTHPVGTSTKALKAEILGQAPWTGR